jgi:hypothetical protein
LGCAVQALRGEVLNVWAEYAKDGAPVAARCAAAAS